MRLAALLVALAVSGAVPAVCAQIADTRSVVVRGRVVSGDDSTVPLRGARVSVVGSAVPIEPVFTDENGTFAVGAPASSTLAIAKAGFAPAIVTGTARPGSDDLHVALSRGAVLTGVVVDELGFPVHTARVRARWLDPVAGMAAAALVEFTGDTDETGRYRIGSLPAGRYTLHTERQLDRLAEMEHPGDPLADLRRAEMLRLLSARVIPMSAPVAVQARPGEDAFATLVHTARAVTPPDAPIGGFAGGTVFDQFGEPLQGVTLRLRRLRYATDRTEAERASLLRRSDDRGYFRFFHVPPGRYLLEAVVDETSYAPVYYPGVSTIGAATPIVIGRTQDVSGLNVVFTRARETRVFGFALDAAGGPLDGTVSLTASIRSGAPALPPRNVRPDDTGVFEFLNVPPGEYVLRATRSAARGQHLEEFGLQYATVDGRDLPPITIAASRTATLAGRVLFEGDASGLSPRDFGLTTVPDPDDGPVGPAVSVPADDATFEMRGLAGTLRVSNGRAPNGWWLKSVDIGGINAAELPVRFAGVRDSRSDVTVVWSAAVAIITGRVTDEGGRPADDYRVLAFSVDRARWFGRSPYVRLTGGPDADGSFTQRALPPGDYFVVAVDRIDGDGAAGEWQNPDVLGALVANATRVSVREGQRIPTELRLTRWGR